MGDIDGANYSPGWGSWNVSQAGSLSLLQGEILFQILSRNLVPLDQPVKETGDLMANVQLWYNVVNLYKTIGQ